MRPILLASLLLAGCAAPTYTEMADADCRAWGAQPNTSAYVECMGTRVAALEAADRAAFAGLAETSRWSADRLPAIPPPTYQRPHVPMYQPRSF